MSTDITMQELELEHAELLPSRETLWCGGSSHSAGFNQVAVAGSSQNGLINVSVLSGDNILDNIVL